MDLTQLRRETNVHHLGQIAPDDLPRYAAHFDVGLIPFLANDFNRYCNPIKLKEYLALGFPIVATRLPAFERYGPCIYLADTHEQFLAQIDAALSESPSDGLPRRRREAVADDSWDRIADRAAQLMDLSVPTERATALNAL
jgi:glycosyltransferase involved in cell wall biosynthesis